MTPQEKVQYIHVWRSGWSGDGATTAHPSSRKRGIQNVTRLAGIVGQYPMMLEPDVLSIQPRNFNELRQS